MSRAKVVVDESVVRVITVGQQGPPGPAGEDGADVGYVDAGDTASRARANHTGTQPASTISDLPTAVDARVAIQKGVANGLATLGPTTRSQARSYRPLRSRIRSLSPLRPRCSLSRRKSAMLLSGRT